MDISTNELANASIPVAEAPYMLSKYARSYLEALTSGQEDIVSKSNAQSGVVKSFVEGEVSRLDTANSNLVALAQQSTAFAAADRALIRSSLAQAEATLNQTITDEVATLNEVDAGLRVDVDDLLQWRIDNTDEIAGEVDKAINAKVDETLFQAVKTALETADTQFSQDLAQAITDRINKDAEHTALLERMEAFANVVLALNELEDGDGNRLNSFADVLASTGVGIPMAIVADILAEYVRDEINDITIATVANRDAGKLVRAHFTLPEGVSLSYQEGGQGPYIPLVDVFGPASGFPLGDISSEFELQVSISGSYSVLVEFKEVANGNVLGSKTLSFVVVDPEPVGPAQPIELLKPVSTANPSHRLTGHPLLETSNYNNEGIMMQVPTGESFDSTSSFRAPPMVGAQNIYRRNLRNSGILINETLPDNAYTRSQGQWVKFFADGTYEAFNGTSTGTGTWVQVAF